MSPRGDAPRTDPEYASPRIPDEDRTWLAFGANFLSSDAVSLDVSYAVFGGI